jgi:carnosine N-methyltransferase
VNFGPLLYHFAELQDQLSLELSWEELKFAIEKTGFQITQQQFSESTYSQHQETMMLTVYKCVFFTAVKV